MRASTVTGLILASMVGLGLVFAPAMVRAQGAVSTMSPPSPNAANGMPQPANSVPPGTGTAPKPRAGNVIHRYGTGRSGERPMTRQSAPVETTPAQPAR